MYHKDIKDSYIFSTVVKRVNDKQERLVYELPIHFISSLNKVLCKAVQYCITPI